MSEAAWAVLGVLVGSLLPFLAGLWSERRADARVEGDRLERREARLFDARRTAYENYQTIARSLLDQAWEHSAGLSKSAPPDFDFTDSMIEALGPVRLYASPHTVDSAEALLRAVSDYAAGDVADGPSVQLQNDAYDHVDSALKAFSATARADLGGGPHGGPRLESTS